MRERERERDRERERGGGARARVTRRDFASLVSWCLEGFGLFGGLGRFEVKWVEDT